jgi:hypothetical protein
MKNRYFLVSSLLLSNFFSKGQSIDTTSSIQVNKTEVELLYNHYIQSGNNSAITGGIGTEQLSVYGPSISVKKSFGLNAIKFQLGTDVVSSASADNIDSVVSSVSKLDARTYANIGYERTLEKNQITLSVGSGISLESDYSSLGTFLGGSFTAKDKMQTYSLDLQMFNDDLRWGRLNPQTGHKPVYLIYPEELRFQEWYDTYKRNSYNAIFGYSQVINERNVFGISGILSFQEGLLETPFHRIYFNDATLAVEQLPPERYKGTLAFKLNSFVSGNTIVKNSVSGYADNFGIKGIALEHETALKLNSKWTLYGNARYYNQSSSMYFAGYMQHDPNQDFYTSDYDLSAFNTLKIGIGAKLSPYTYTKYNTRFDTAVLKYNYYRRSNNLDAHMMSLSINTSKLKKRKRRH